MAEKEILVRKAIQLKIEEAEKARDDAAYGGEYHDGGYSVEMKIIAAFQDGITYEQIGKIPSWLNVYVDKAKKMNDPEWENYLRLKNKFEKET